MLFDQFLKKVHALFMSRAERPGLVTPRKIVLMDMRADIKILLDDGNVPLDSVLPRLASFV